MQWFGHSLSGMVTGNEPLAVSWPLILLGAQWLVSVTADLSPHSGITRWYWWEPSTDSLVLNLEVDEVHLAPLLVSTLPGPQVPIQVIRVAVWATSLGWRVPGSSPSPRGHSSGPGAYLVWSKSPVISQLQKGK